MLRAALPVLTPVTVLPLTVTSLSPPPIKIEDPNMLVRVLSETVTAAAWHRTMPPEFVLSLPRMVTLDTDPPAAIRTLALVWLMKWLSETDEVRLVAAMNWTPAPLPAP